MGPTEEYQGQKQYELGLVHGLGEMRELVERVEAERDRWKELYVAKCETRRRRLVRAMRGVRAG